MGKKRAGGIAVARVRAREKFNENLLIARGRICKWPNTEVPRFLRSAVSDVLMDRATIIGSVPICERLDRRSFQTAIPWIESLLFDMLATELADRDSFMAVLFRSREDVRWA